MFRFSGSIALATHRSYTAAASQRSPCPKPSGAQAVAHACKLADALSFTMSFINTPEEQSLPRKWSADFRSPCGGTVGKVHCHTFETSILTRFMWKSGKVRLQESGTGLRIGQCVASL